jgi:hypothetical protein
VWASNRPSSCSAQRRVRRCGAPCVQRRADGGNFRRLHTNVRERGRVVSLADGIGRRAGALRKMLKGFRRAVRDGAIADADCPPDDDIITWHGHHPRRGGVTIALLSTCRRALPRGSVEQP